MSLYLPVVADVSDKHSTFSTTFPIYVREATAKERSEDDDEPVDEDDKWDYTWTHVNNQAPIWMR